MPHDLNGKELKVGDRVVIPAIVTAIHPSRDYCNLDVQFEHPMPPYRERTRFAALNSRQAVLAEGDKADIGPPAIPIPGAPSGEGQGGG